MLPFLLVALAACTAPSDDDTTAAPTGDVTTVALMSTLTFEPIVDGMSRGFNLDGLVTERGDGCGSGDYVSPTGEDGIDNAFGGLIPLITSLGGEALQSLVQDAVTSGELLLIVEMDDVGGTPTGTCGTGRMVRGVGQPYLGAAGNVLANQTFGVSSEIAGTELSCVRPMADGTIIAEGVQLRLPLNVFDETIDLTLLDGRLILQPAEGGGWTGVVGGGVSVAELSANVLGFDAIPEELEQGVVSAVELTADLAPDASGDCQQLSVTIGFDAVPAFLYPDLTE